MSATTANELLELITSLKGDLQWKDYAAFLGTSLSRSVAVRAKLKESSLAVKLDFLDLVAQAHGLHAVGFAFDGAVWVPEGHGETFRREMGLCLSDFRKSRGFTTNELAERASVSQSTVLNYEKGRTWTTAYVVQAVCRSLGSQPSYLVPHNT